jgi:hypothetical protein
VDCHGSQHFPLESTTVFWFHQWALEAQASQWKGMERQSNGKWIHLSLIIDVFDSSRCWKCCLFWSSLEMICHLIVSKYCSEQDGRAVWTQDFNLLVKVQNSLRKWTWFCGATFGYRAMCWTLLLAVTDKGPVSIYIYICVCARYIAYALHRIISHKITSHYITSHSRNLLKDTKRIVRVYAGDP